MTTKKLIAGFVTVMFVLGLVVPAGAGAATAEELQQQIDALLAQIAELQQQLSDLGGGDGEVSGDCPANCAGVTLERNLQLGMTGDDVKCLQSLFNTDDSTKVAETGAGSPGNETSYYGSLTKAAAVKFQEKYSEDVLAPWGLTAGTGFFGSTSRAKANELLTALCATPTPTPTECAEYTTESDCTGAGCYWYDDTCHADAEVPPVTGEDVLTVAVASDTPAAATIADNANANFTKVTFTAGDEDVSIKKIYVTRTGNTGNADVENIKFVDMDGVKYGSTGSLNVNSKAMITFSTNLVIEAGTSESYYIRAGFADTTSGGKTAALGIASVDDIEVAGDTSVSGSFPLYGNTMSVVDMTIGSVSLEEITLVDSTPDIGDTDVVISEFKITAGSTEGVTVEQLTAMEAGTAALDDVENVELYSVTNGTSLGETSWDSSGKAHWNNLNLSIDKGETHRFQIRVDVLDGTGLTLNADIKDGSDSLVTVKGNTYGYYMTPTWTSSWDGKGTDQTVNTGALSISKSSSTPATGNIAPGATADLVTFDFTATGEEVKISTLEITFATLTNAGGSKTFDYNDITNVKIVDENGTLVAGPSDLTTGNDVTFNDTFIVPVGTHQYTVSAKIGNDAETGDTVQAGINDASSAAQVSATGMTSHNTIQPTATEVNGNVMTVAGADLAATTLTEPEAQSVAKGVTDFVWMTASLSAVDSGEDVNVTAMVIEDTFVDASGSDNGFADIDNVEIWADLTDADSPRGDKFETKVSNTEQPDDAADSDGTGDDLETFSLNTTITVPKGTYVEIALVGDLSANAGTGDKHRISLDEAASAVTATGADTGSTVSVTPTGGGQIMTVATSGDLVVSEDSSSPKADILLSQETQTLAILRLAANSVENIDIDNIYLSVTGGTYVDTYYLYHDGTAIASASGGTTPKFVFADGTLTIPANGHEEVTVKAKMVNIAYDSTTDENNNDVIVALTDTYDVDWTGLSSGSSSSTDDSVTCATHQTYESRPYVKLSKSSPGDGNLIPSSQDLLAVFDVEAASQEDITFNPSNNNVFRVEVDSTLNASDSTSETWYLKDEYGTTLDTESVAEQDGDYYVEFDFGTDGTGTTFTVPAGQTKKLYVYANTTDYSHDGDVIQLWLDDGNNTGLDFSIDSEGTGYDEGAIIFRGDIWAGSFVNPS